MLISWASFTVTSSWKNILMKSNGDILLSDFGCALVRPAEEHALYVWEAVWGTKEYMAPELYFYSDKDGADVYNNKVDSRSLISFFLASRPRKIVSLRSQLSKVH